MTSRQAAIEAGAAAMFVRYGYWPASGNAKDHYWVHALDAAVAAHQIHWADHCPGNKQQRKERKEWRALKRKADENTIAVVEEREALRAERDALRDAALGLMAFLDANKNTYVVWQVRKLAAPEMLALRALLDQPKPSADQTLHTEYCLGSPSHSGACPGPEPTPAGARCESCTQPATVTLPDGSHWCRECDGSARRLGYDQPEPDDAPLPRAWERFPRPRPESTPEQESGDG